MFLILCMMILTSCATNGSEAYNQELQNWVGMSPEALYHSWGLPAEEIYPAPGMKVVTYVNTFNGPIDGNTQPYAEEIDYSAIAVPDYGQNPNAGGSYYCKTSFTIENNEIVDYSFNGDDCVTGN